uniref:Putative secreted protein n=1 Tax=Anopheles triannulatus TaxID=58253 RepID=A0A2M4B6Z6_9DIPT
MRSMRSRSGVGSQRRPACLPALLLRPAHILADELVELLIVLDEELAQLRHDDRIDARVLPALRLAQTLVPRLVPQAVEALRLVEVEIIATDAWFDA